MTAATLLVAGCPVAIVWWLRGSDTISSPVLGVLLGMALSLVASQFGRFLWEKRPGSEDLLFSELMLWGFLHRRYTERRLTSALDMLAPMSEGGRTALDGLSSKRQAKLLERLVSGMETRDPYLHNHSRRVARHAWMIARGMGLSRAEVARIRTAAAIHDVGKINTPKAILHKPGSLSAEEYEVIKLHPGEGAEMAAVLGDDELTSMVRHHHERLDGTGYPDGLSAFQIPLGARIVAVADTFDAITSARPYRAASPHRVAMDILKAEAGTKLDPEVVRAFNRHYAGRRPIAMWAFVAGLPERVLSWLGGGVGSVASAAKMVAVAALVGGTAAASSTLAAPTIKHGSTKAGGVSAAAVAHAIQSSSPSALAPSGGTATRAQRADRAGQGAGSSAPAISRASQPAATSAAGVVGAQPSQSGVGGAAGQGAGAAGGASSGSHGKTEEAHGKTEEAHGKSEAPHAKGEGSSGKGSHGKSEESHGKGEGSHGNGEGSKGKSEESHGKSEESHGKSEEAHGKSEEAPVKSETSHGKSEEAPVKSEESAGSGKSEESQGKSEGSSGKGGGHGKG